MGATSFTTRKNTAAISTETKESAGTRQEDPRHSTQVQHQGPTGKHLDSMHSKANAAVIGQRDKTHKAGNQ